MGSLYRWNCLDLEACVMPQVEWTGDYEALRLYIESTWGTGGDPENALAALRRLRKANSSGPTTVRLTETKAPAGSQKKHK